MDYKLFRFDQKLIDRLKRYWKKRVGEDISDETANEYLTSFAGLYESFIELANPRYDKTEDNKDIKR